MKNTSSKKRKAPFSTPATTPKPKKLKKMTSIEVLNSLLQILHQNDYLEILALKKLFYNIQQVQEQQEKSTKANSNSSKTLSQLYINLDHMENQQVASHLKVLLKNNWEFSRASKGYFMKYQSSLRPKRLYNWFMDVLNGYMTQKLDLKDKLGRISRNEEEYLLSKKDTVEYWDVNDFQKAQQKQEDSKIKKSSLKDRQKEASNSVHHMRRSGKSLVELHRETSRGSQYEKNATQKPITSVYDLNNAAEEEQPEDEEFSPEMMRQLKDASQHQPRMTAQQRKNLQQQGFLTFNRGDLMSEGTLKRRGDGSSASVGSASDDLRDRFS